MKKNDLRTKNMIAKLIFVMLCSVSCSKIYFTEIQDVGGKKETLFPEILQGTWYYQNQTYQILTDRIIEGEKKWELNYDISLFKRKSFYVINEKDKENKGLFRIYILKPIKNGDIFFWPIWSFYDATILKSNKTLKLESVLRHGEGEYIESGYLEPNDSDKFESAIFSGKIEINDLHSIEEKISPNILKRGGAVIVPKSLLNEDFASEYLNQNKSNGKFNSKDKFKVVRVKERNLGNNCPITIEIYDKSLSLKVGDNIVITRTDEVKIPGEKRTIKSETNMGKARITEDFNNPLYTVKLIANDGCNLKDYKDGDENYNALKGEEKITMIASPKIMVIPKKIDPNKYLNGEYQLTKYEKMLIAAFKNKFEDNKFTTYGFESSLKSVLENRQFNDNVQDDIKSKILESSGMDFFVEYENLDQNNTKCEKVFDFKIRNYSTGEDVASDVKSLNICGSPDDYKSFALEILNDGAISKISIQFSSLLNNGRKVSVIFAIANSSQANFNKDYNGIKLKDHIENCLQGLAFNGNLDIEGVVNLRMETSVNIPIINENTGKSYTTNTFSEDIIGYLKKNANVECESSVSKQSVNIRIK
jgi:hypothetical protein